MFGAFQQDISRAPEKELSKVREEGEVFSKKPTRIPRVWVWIGVTALFAVIVLSLVGELMLRRAGPILKGRVIETLSTRFDSRVEMEGFSVSLLHGLEVSGDGVRIFPPDDVVAAGWEKPLISLQHF